MHALSAPTPQPLNGQPTLVALALGSNLGDRALHLRDALAALRTLPTTTLVACSAFFRTPPVGPVVQGEFLNAAALIHTSLAPLDLLACLQALERAAGRDRTPGTQRWGPRTLDLDVLLYGEQLLRSETLTIPHPRMHERAFVLVPLASIAPTMRVPRSPDSSDTRASTSVRELLTALPCSEVHSVVRWSAQAPPSGEGGASKQSCCECVDGCRACCRPSRLVVP